jgi:hypothetical protein
VSAGNAELGVIRHPAASREPVEGVTYLPFSASYLATIWAGMRAARLICSAVAC